MLSRSSSSTRSSRRSDSSSSRSSRSGSSRTPSRTPSRRSVTSRNSATSNQQSHVPPPVASVLLEAAAAPADNVAHSRSSSRSSRSSRSTTEHSAQRSNNNGDHDGAMTERSSQHDGAAAAVSAIEDVLQVERRLDERESSGDADHHATTDIDRSSSSNDDPKVDQDHQNDMHAQQHPQQHQQQQQQQPQRAATTDVSNDGDTVSINPELQSIVSGRTSQRYDDGDSGDDEGLLPPHRHHHHHHSQRQLQTQTSSPDGHNQLHSHQQRSFHQELDQQTEDASHHAQHVQHAQSVARVSHDDAREEAGEDHQAASSPEKRSLSTRSSSSSSPSSAGRSLFDDAVPPPYSDEPQDAFYSTGAPGHTNAMQPTLSVLLSGGNVAGVASTTPKQRQKSMSPQHATQSEAAAAAAAKAAVHKNAIEVAFLAEYIFVHRLSALTPEALDTLHLEEKARHESLLATQATLDDCLEGLSEFVVWYQLEWERKRRSDVLMSEVFPVAAAAAGTAGGGVVAASTAPVVMAGVVHQKGQSNGKKQQKQRHTTTTTEGAVAVEGAAAHVKDAPPGHHKNTTANVSPQRQQQPQHLAQHHLLALHSHHGDRTVDLSSKLSGAAGNGVATGGGSARMAATQEAEDDLERFLLGAHATSLQPHSHAVTVPDEGLHHGEDNFSPMRNSKRRLSYDDNEGNDEESERHHLHGSGSPTSVNLGSPADVSTVMSHPPHHDDDDKAPPRLPAVLQDTSPFHGGGRRSFNHQPGGLRRSGSLSVSINDDKMGENISSPHLASSGSGVVLHGSSSSPIGTTTDVSTAPPVVVVATQQLYGGHLSPTLHHIHPTHRMPPKDIDHAMSLLHSITTATDAASSGVQVGGGASSTASPLMMASGAFSPKSSVAQLRASVEEARSSRKEGGGGVSPDLHMSWAQSCDDDDHEAENDDEIAASESHRPQHMTKPNAALTSADAQPAAPSSSFHPQLQSVHPTHALKLRMIANIERRIEAAKASLRGATPQLVGCARRLMNLELEAQAARAENALLEAQFIESKQTLVDFEQLSGFRNEADLDAKLHEKVMQHQDAIRALHEETVLWKKAARQANLLATGSQRRIRQLEDKIVTQTEHHLRGGDTVPRLQELTNRQQRLLDRLKHYISVETMRTRRELALAAGRRLLSGGERRGPDADDSDGVSNLSTHPLPTTSTTAHHGTLEPLGHHHLQFSAASPQRKQPLLSAAGGIGSPSPAGFVLGGDRHHLVPKDVFHRLTASLPDRIASNAPQHQGLSPQPHHGRRGQGGSLSPQPTMKSRLKGAHTGNAGDGLVPRPEHVVGSVWGRVADGNM